MWSDTSIQISWRSEVTSWSSRSFDHCCSIESLEMPSIYHVHFAERTKWPICGVWAPNLPSRPTPQDVPLQGFDPRAKTCAGLAACLVQTILKMHIRTRSHVPQLLCIILSMFMSNCYRLQLHIFDTDWYRYSHWVKSYMAWSLILCGQHRSASLSTQTCGLRASFYQGARVAHHAQCIMHTSRRTRAAWEIEVKMGRLARPK